MGIAVRFIDFNNIFSLADDPIVINELPTETKTERQRLEQILTTRYSKNDTISTIPSCDCKKLKGNRFLNMICDVCGTAVKDPTVYETTFSHFIRPPKGVEPFINPQIWFMLTKAFKVASFDTILWLTDRSYPSPKSKNDGYQSIINSKIERGYNHFVEHFFEILEQLMSFKIFEKGPKGNQRRLLIDELKKRNPKYIFANYLPLPDRSMMIVEQAINRTYIRSENITLLDAVLSLSSIDESDKPTIVWQNKTSRALNKFADFYDAYAKKSSKKAGDKRKHLFSTRVNFNARFVITSITNRHRHDEVYMPWSGSVTLFEYHLASKLDKLGYTANEAYELIRAATLNHHPLIERLLNELLEEAPNHRIPVIVSRNPVNRHGSMQLCYIALFKTDPKDNTLSIPIMSTKIPNADFDGDAYNVMLPLDNTMVFWMRYLAPSTSIFDPYGVMVSSSATSFPKTIAVTGAHYLADTKLDKPTPSQRRFMESLAQR